MRHRLRFRYAIAFAAAALVALAVACGSSDGPDAAAAADADAGGHDASTDGDASADNGGGGHDASTDGDATADDAGADDAGDAGDASTTVLLELDALPNWWRTSPAVQLGNYSTLRLEMAFKNETGGTLQFGGNDNVDGPSADLQLWTNPNAASFDATELTFTSFPQGDYGPGDVISWDVTIDLAAVADTETAIAIRPNDQHLFGTLDPSQLTLESVTGTLKP